MKTCTVCKITKELFEFNKKSKSPDGLYPQCKPCKRTKDNLNYEKTKEVKKAKANEYYKNNKEKVLKRVTSEENKARRRQLWNLNKEENNKKQSSHRKKFPNKYKERKRQYKIENRDKINEYNRKYRKERMEADPLFRVMRRIRQRTRDAFNVNYWKKDTHFAEYIGCTKEHLEKYLENKFKPGMTWDNYGEWEIDHQIPLGSANNEQEVYKLSHYSNLQPLWKEENSKKSDKIDFSLYTVKLIPSIDTHEFLINNHYLNRVPSISYAFGIFCKEEMVGVMTFGTPSSKNIKTALITSDHTVLELNRLWLRYNRKNEASWFISKALKLLPKNIFIISYADESQDHNGTIYQAANFKYYGMTEKKKEVASLTDPNLHSRQAFYLKQNDPENENYFWRDRPRKHRYVYVTGNQKLYNNIKYQQKPYPTK